eukprot:UN2496
MIENEISLVIQNIISFFQSLIKSLRKTNDWLAVLYLYLFLIASQVPGTQEIERKKHEILLLC